MSLTTLALKTVEYLAPFSTLTYLSAKITDVKLGKFTQFLIRNFIKSFNINLDEIEEQNLEAYETFNDFFIRKLKPNARPISQACLAISPVDGTIGEAGDINAGRLIQAKGVDYSLKELLGGDRTDSAPFEAGKFATIYLSPSNYHRIHMPLDGTLVKTMHIPGKLFPVGQRNISYMPNLYTMNERMVCIFETELGPFAVIMVGAALVGSIHTTWGGTVVRRKGIETNYYDPGQFTYKKGDEIGYFKYGSTVINLWPEGSGEISDELVNGAKVKFGQEMIL